MVLNPTPRFTLNGTIVGSGSFVGVAAGYKEVSGVLDASGQVIGDYVGQKSFGVGIEGTGTFVGAAEQTNTWANTQHFLSNGAAWVSSQTPMYFTVDSSWEVVMQSQQGSTATGNRYGLYQMVAASPSGTASWMRYSGSNQGENAYYYASAGNSTPGIYPIATPAMHSLAVVKYDATTAVAGLSRNAATMTYSTYSRPVSAAGHTLKMANDGGISSSTHKYWNYAVYTPLTPSERTALYNGNVAADFRGLIVKQPRRYYCMSVLRIVGATVYVVDLGTDAPGDGSTDAIVINGSIANFAAGGY